MNKVIAVSVSILGLAAVVAGQAAKAQGTVTVGNTKVAIATGMAVDYKAPNGQLVSVPSLTLEVRRPASTRRSISRSPRNRFTARSGRALSAPRAS